ncbi:MAG: protein-disulfide reductase DsbD family protein [bacterium]|nr:protein-disulfide reductase DsbD family protein [bacterium]
MSSYRHSLFASGSPAGPAALLKMALLAIAMLAMIGTVAPMQATPPAAGVVSGVARSEYTRARLVSAHRRLAPGASFYIGLELEMDPLWHTYWKNPGDSGLATSIRWQLPAGFSAGPILWPTPRRIFVKPLMSYGYGSDDPGAVGRVVLLTRVEVAADAPVGPANLSAAVEWLECKEICLPGEGRLDLKLTVVPAVSPGHASAAESVRTGDLSEGDLLTADLQTALAQLPRGAVAGSELPPTLSSRVQIKDDHLRVEIDGVPPELAQEEQSAPYFFIESEGVVAHAESQSVEVFADGRITLRIPRDLAANQLPADEKEVRGVLKFAPESLSVVDEAWQIRAPVVADGWWRQAALLAGMFLFALLGGALLNLMPCVLPVLSLKVLALVQGVAEDSRRERVFAGGAFAAGVVATFLTLAGVLLVLQAAGAAVGWGYQLQSPAFVLFLLAIVGVFALNLLGVFEFSVVAPRWLAGESTRHNPSGASHFAAGVLATVLATPCTAPFMGTAMGFAFGQGTATTLFIFTGLGLGMALPYWIFAVFPGALAWLPKPGRWMESFKQFSGFLLLATALWLLWVFGRLTGPDAQSLAVGLMLALGLAAWIYGRWFSGFAGSSGANMRPVYISAVAAFWIALALAGLLGWSALQAGAAAGNSARAVGGDGAMQQGDANWQVYSPERVADLRAQGRPVFIDFTADWCLSCKVNEALTFRSERVWRRMRELDVTAFQADWTKQDPVITAALRRYGRSGVPLYVLYGPGPEASPRILPEVLSEGLFLAELEKLGSPPSGR